MKIHQVAVMWVALSLAATAAEPVPLVAYVPQQWSAIQPVAVVDGVEVRAVTTADSLFLELESPTPGGQLCLVLDPYRDGQDEYRTVVNADGTVICASLRKAGWTVPATVAPRAQGWSCVVHVPFASMDYPRSGEASWGLGVGTSPDSLTRCDVTLTAPVSRPVLTSSPLSDTTAVKYEMSRNASMSLTMPPAGFTERVDLRTGQVSESVEYRNSPTAEGSTLAVGWSGRPVAAVDNLHVAASWAEVKSPEGTVQLDSETLSADVRLHQRWDVATSVDEEDSAKGHDSKLLASLGYAGHLGVSVAELTTPSETQSTVTLAGTVDPLPHTRLDLSYLTSDAGSRRGEGIRYSLSKGHTFTLGMGEDAQGFCNLYGTYRREFSPNRQMILTLGDPTANTTTSQVLLKIVDRL